jgi:dipeptidyl aminopeptidase/acylaminoacyl peptidase
MKKKRNLTAEDLYRLRSINECAISPDGEHIIYSVLSVDEQKNKKKSNLWVCSIKNGNSEQFTVGNQVDSSPRWSPDGKKIAFLSNRDDEKQPQIYLIPFSGGEARPLTDIQGEFAGFKWSPTGEDIICQFRKKDQDAIERDEDDLKKELGIVSRRVQRVFYKFDGRGFLPDERWHIWKINGKTGEITQLTDGNIFDETFPNWSPDGRDIVFLSNHAEDPDLDPDAIDVFIHSIERGKTKKIPTPVGPKKDPVFSPDGKWIVYYGKEGRDNGWKNTSLWLVPADGKEGAVNLTQEFDLDLSDTIINDFPGHLPLSPPTWSADSSLIYFSVSRHGKATLHSIKKEGGPESMETLIDQGGTLGSVTFDEEQSGIAYLHSSIQEPPEVMVYDLTENRSQKLSHVNQAVLEEIQLGEVEMVWFKGDEGNDLQGWIMKPPSYKEGTQYPAILEIHGGPRAQYGDIFMHEFHYLAAQGYVVFFSNPRGGQGYGEDHSKAIWNNWGTVDYDDIMAWTEFVSQQPYVDSERLGITGGSYGGYMTNWIIGKTNRFQAAVTQRSVSNLISMYGSSDFNWAFQFEFGNQPPWENLENYWRQSPMKHIGNAQTPTLVIHSENDLRVSIEQGEQVFVALKMLGVDTEMIRYPDEPHGLSRGGRTDRRIDRLNHILRWFNKYLQDDESTQ